ncbi:DNA replication and repair protein RecF [Bifidobacterium sp. ESL0690]|uniref:DNA replication/repair protein RecF n=1 Tax=Bifidobacterium sp. ESL0690 TaxID=2983214 RepID=UPI0023FA0DF5|nr:DNA replication and repair protein RecF [Bifidobacterium sp. ESL0690]WEV46737.1 DNA replication and repair protein RecF [Bifidobacterium sp. ESL0690]
MYISRLALDHFRSWPYLVVDFIPGVTILKGANGLGKTNIVEAVEVLSTGSSHRVSSTLPLIERGEAKATIRANVNETNGNDDDNDVEATYESVNNDSVQVAVNSPIDGFAANAKQSSSEERGSGALIGDATTQESVESNKYPADSNVRETTYEVTIAARGANRGRINGGNSLYMRDIVGKVPSVSFTPDDQRLVAGDPAGRRGFLDQAGSLLIPGYAANLSNANKIAKQRAALLKQLGQRNEPADAQDAALNGLEIWTGQFIGVGVALTRARAGLIERLAGPFSSIYDELAGKPQHAGLSYAPSFEEVLDFEQPEPEISKHYQRLYAGEIARGRNLIGPHRDDMTLTLDDMPAREFASNGEMWTMALALKMALFNEIAEAQQVKPIVILDDVFAQLDETRRRQILDFAMQQDQVLITVAAAGDIPLNATQAGKATIIDVAELKAGSEDENANLVAQLQAARENNNDTDGAES